jgi:phosphoribosylaminoimidazole-succinocarboxamide synthase
MEFAVPGREPLSGEVHGRVLPVEWIWRSYAKGSLLQRLRQGKILPEQLGFPKGTLVEDGMKLPRVHLECTTKFEPTDRHLSHEETMDLAGLSESQMRDAWDLIENSVKVTGDAYEQAGFYCPDGKLELGITPEGALIIVDVFGTPDENRIIGKKQQLSFSKDLIRDYLKVEKAEWYDKLLAAKLVHPSDKSQWPDYPTLPEKFVKMVARRYKLVAFQYGGTFLN